MIIGKFSNRTGISPYTLRYYEKKGLLFVKRDAGGRRESILEEQKRWTEYLNNLDEKIEIYRKRIELG